MSKKVAIIGAGYTGMIASKKLLEEGYEVTIYEKSSKPGGIAQSIDMDETKIEKHYRHIFKCDNYVIDLIKELGLKNELQWLKSKMGYYTNNKKYRFGQALTLLTYKPLSFIEKIRFRDRIFKNKIYKGLHKNRKYNSRKMGYRKLRKKSI